MRFIVFIILSLTLLSSSTLGKVTVSPLFPESAKIVTKVLSLGTEAIFNLGSKMHSTSAEFTSAWGVVSNPLPAQSYNLHTDFQSSKTLRFRSKNTWMELVAFNRKTDECVAEIWFDRYTRFHEKYSISQESCGKLTVAPRLNTKNQLFMSFVDEKGYLNWQIITAYKSSIGFIKSKLNLYEMKVLSPNEYYDITLVPFSKSEYWKIYQKASDREGNYPEIGVYFSIDKGTSKIVPYDPTFLYNRGGKANNVCLDKKGKTTWHNIAPGYFDKDSFYYFSDITGPSSNCYQGGVGIVAKGKLYTDSDRYDVQSSIKTMPGRTYSGLTFTNRNNMFSWTYTSPINVDLFDATRAGKYSPNKFYYGKVEDTSMTPLADDEYIDDIEPRFDYVYVLRSRIKGSNVDQNEQVLTSKDFAPGMDIDTSSNRYSANYDTLMSVPRSFKSSNTPQVTFADSPMNPRFGYWINPGNDTPNKQIITAKDSSMSTSVQYAIKLQKSDQFQKTQVDDDEQYLDFSKSDVGKTKIFTQSPVSVQGDRIRLKSPYDTSVNWATYTLISPATNSLRENLIYHGSETSEVYHLAMRQNSFQQVSQQVESDFQVVCAMKDVILYQKNGKISSFSQRIVRDGVDLGPNAFRIDLSSHDLKINNVVCTNEANLVLWKNARSTYAMSWDIGGGSKSGEFYIRQFYTELDTKTVTSVKYSQSAFSYRLETTSGKAWNLTFNSAIPVVHLTDSTWFGTDQKVTSCVQSVGHDGKDIKSWDIQFTIKKPKSLSLDSK